jgi:hypothetical protein
MKKKISTWLSRLFSKKEQSVEPQEEATYGLSCDKSVKLNEDPSVKCLKEIAFFRPRADAGPFEIRRIEYVRDQHDPYYVIYSTEAHREFRISKYWFDVIFEPYSLNFDGKVSTCRS